MLFKYLCKSIILFRYSIICIYKTDMNLPVHCYTVDVEEAGLCISFLDVFWDKCHFMRGIVIHKLEARMCLYFLYVSSDMVSQRCSCV